VAKKMGADIEYRSPKEVCGQRVADIAIKGIGALSGIDVPPEEVPSMIDEIPALAMLAACANGVTRMSGLAELRVKESDRLALVAKGLIACGVRLEEGEDTLTIHGNGTPPKGGALIASALDHRIAMSSLTLGCAAKNTITIDDARPIETSFPHFAELMNGVGCRINV